MGKAAIVYAWMTAALTPLVFLHFRVRRLRGLELPMHGPEKAGYASATRPNGSLLWFHAVSVGEGMEAIPVIKQCLKARPYINILMTTSTVTAFSILQQTLPQGVICQFAPVDTPIAVERFLIYWKPQAAVFMESELWPNLILKSSRQGIRLALLNARMSQKSFGRWSLSPAKNLAAEMISKFCLIMPINNIEALRYQHLGALPHQIQFGGNLKYASGAMELAAVNGQSFLDLKKRLLGRRVWLAASTHPGEEEAVASVHHMLMHSYPSVLTIIVPRHPHRVYDAKVFLEGPAEILERAGHQEHGNIHCRYSRFGLFTLVDVASLRPYVEHGVVTRGSLQDQPNEAFWIVLTRFTYSWITAHLSREPYFYKIVRVHYRNFEREVISDMDEALENGIHA